MRTSEPTAAGRQHNPFLAFIEALAAPLTRAAYASTLRLLDTHFRPFTGREDEQGLLTFVRDLERRGLAPSTVRKQLHRMRRLISWAEMRGLRVGNPVNLSWVGRTRDTRPPRCLTRNEIEGVARVLDHSTWRGRRDAAIFSLMFFEGLRVAEVAKLDRRDITWH